MNGAFNEVIAASDRDRSALFAETAARLGTVACGSGSTDAECSATADSASRATTTTFTSS